MSATEDEGNTACNILDDGDGGDAEACSDVLDVYEGSIVDSSGWNPVVSLEMEPHECMRP